MKRGRRNAVVGAIGLWLWTSNRARSDAQRTLNMVRAPFTPEQVLNLWTWQNNPRVHPFTCRNRGDHPELLGDKGVLIPTVKGWVCMFCDYTQDWAHDFMVRQNERH